MADSFEKYSPWAAGVLNLVLSGVGSYDAIFIAPIAGLETPSFWVAILGALAFTVFAFVFPRSVVWTLLIIFVVLFVPAIAWYHQILSRAGATNAQLYVALFLYFFAYVTIFFVVANFERFVINYFSKG